MAADAPKTSSGIGGGGGGASLTGVVVVVVVRVLCLVLLSTGKEITNEGDLVEQSNSSISVEKPVTTAFGNRRRTLRWRIGSSNSLTASTSYNGYKEPWSSTVPLMPFKASGFETNSMSEPRDIDQQSWTLHPKSEIADNILKTSTTSDAKSVGQPLEETKKMNTRNATAERVSSALESFQAKTDATLISSSSVMASDVFRFDYSQNKEQKLFGEASDYGNGENEDYEDEEEEEDEDYNSNDDERDYYNGDYPYEEEQNENGRLRDPAEYEGNAYRDSVGEAGHRYFREGNLRLPINYSDGTVYKEYGLEYERDYQLRLPQNRPPDPGNREIRRLVIGGKTNQIDTSLLVIYAWLGLVVVMIAITVVIFKYKQQLSARCLKLTSNCRKVRQVIGIEEGNNLLGHPLV